MNIPADIFSVFLIDLPLSTFQTATGESPRRFSVFHSEESKLSENGAYSLKVLCRVKHTNCYFAFTTIISRISVV